MNKFKEILNILFAPVKNQLNRALYEYRMFNGQAVIPADNPDAYLTEGYAGNSDIYSIISRVDSMRKQAKLKLYRQIKDGENDEVTDHELLQWLHKVNPSMYTDEFISAAIIYEMVIGNFFSYTPRLSAGPNRGKVGAIYAMPSNDVEVLFGDWMEPVKGYKLEDSNQKFTPEEVYHIKMFNPLFGSDLDFFGQSPLKAARRILAKQNEAELTELKQFENQGPPYLLYRDVSEMGAINTLSPTQRDEMQDKIKKHAASNSRGLPLVLREKYGIINLGQELASLNILASSQEGRRVLCNVYGMPPALFGDTAGSTYNNMTTARKAAWTDCIMPRLKAIEQMFNAVLIERVDAYKDLYFAYDYSEVEELQDGMKTRVEWMRLAHWTANEIRQATGKYPIQEPIMDEPLFQTGEVPLSQMTLDNELTPDTFGDFTNT